MWVFAVFAVFAAQGLLGSLYLLIVKIDFSVADRANKIRKLRWRENEKRKEEMTTSRPCARKTNSCLITYPFACHQASHYFPHLLASLHTQQHSSKSRGRATCQKQGTWNKNFNILLCPSGWLLVLRSSLTKVSWLFVAAQSLHHYRVRKKGEEHHE